MKTHRRIGAILDIVRGSPGLKPEQKERLEKHVKALNRAMRVRDFRLIRAAVERIAQDLVGTLD